MGKILDNEELQIMVDYSFGDHSGVLGGVPNAYMKKANRTNEEFCKKAVEFTNKTMTLFIDNIRLYRRPIEYSDWLHMKPVTEQDREWLNQFEDEDLLKLCAQFKFTRFVIFTAFEDTPLDEHIRVPQNVKAIHSANGVVFGGKIHPFPHGVERIMYEGYDHHAILEEYMEKDIKPTKQLLVCQRDDTGDRKRIREILKDIATISPPLDYEPYLQAIKDHKFVLCPSGNGIESARNWETLYMGRVPVFKRHPYLEEIFKDFPVLFVDEFEDITEQLLKDNEHLFDQEIDPDLLDLQKIYDLRLNAVL